MNFYLHKSNTWLPSFFVLAPPHFHCLGVIQNMPRLHVKGYRPVQFPGDVRDAIAREKQIKGWVRKKKIALIESVNPEWEEIRL